MGFGEANIKTEYRKENIKRLLCRVIFIANSMTLIKALKKSALVFQRSDYGE